MIFREALTQAAASLAQAGIEWPVREARLLLTHAGADARDGAAAVPDAFWALLQRRCAREPMALITGRQGFWTLDLQVSRDTLIPRADSETLIEAALAEFSDRSRVRRILDLGTGTGALLLAALSEFPGATGVGVDISPAACALARRNAAAHGLAGRVAMLAADWGGCLDGAFDLVLANPPYVEAAAIAALMPEVARFEPARALDGGTDGLDAFRAIVADLPRLVAADGAAVLEIGLGQAASVATLAMQGGLTSAGVRRDLGGNERAVVLKKQVGTGAGRD